MIRIFWISAIIGAIFLVTAFMPTISELPFGMDQAGLLFFGTLNAFVAIDPFSAVVWNRILFVAGIYLLLISWHFIRIVLDWIK